MVPENCTPDSSTGVILIKSSELYEKLVLGKLVRP